MASLGQTYLGFEATGLIVAAGQGERLGSGVPKQYRSLGGKPVLRWAVEALLRSPHVGCVRVVIGENQVSHATHALRDLDVGAFIIGGETREKSVRNGLEHVTTEAVLVHDAARPFCSLSVIDRLIESLADHDAAIPVLPVTDTLARADQSLREPIDRTGAVRVQTPQAFRTSVLRNAYDEWQGETPTDEATVAHAAGVSVATVQGDSMLDKLTSRDDWARAEALLAARLTPRIGYGFDVHAFAGDGPIMLGGVAVPHQRGLSGHSDADVVLHALTDALLGAGALGDIGEHFPPSDPQWKGASSELFLGHAAQLIQVRGGVIDHVDCTLITEEPKIGPYRSAIRTRIAAILNLRMDQVSIKATTSEGLGFTGRREGIAAQAVASVRMEVPE